MILKFMSRPGFFRLLLAFLVFVHHATRLNLGSAAVFIFFILSGYWISTMWNERYSKSCLPYLTYIVSRLWRLLPTFILCSAIAWLVLITKERVPQSINFEHQIFSNILIFGYNSLPFKPNVPAWSLDIELQFYFFAPLLLVFAKKNIWFVLSCALISIVAYLFNDLKSFAPYLLFFSIGIASSAIGWKPTSATALCSLIMTICVIGIIVVSPFSNLLLGGANPTYLYTNYNAFCELIIALLIAPWAIYTTGLQDTKIDRILGNFSYIFYLLHFPVLLAINTGSGTHFHRLIMISTALIVTFLGTAVIWKLYDHPINRLRSKWVSRRVAIREGL